MKNFLPPEKFPSSWKLTYSLYCIPIKYMCITVWIPVPSYVCRSSVWNNKMASGCLGNPGAHRTYFSSSKNPDIGTINDGRNYGDIVWIKKRYIPTDLRSTAPVSRHKLIAPDVKSLQKPESHWIKSKEPIPRAFQNLARVPNQHFSQPSTRCEQWSTLIQILPSRGYQLPRRPPNWGTGHSPAPVMSVTGVRRFPHINSPMTR